MLLFFWEKGRCNVEIKVRNIDVVTVKKIDELAKSKGMSRNAYLKNQIEKLAWVDVLQEERNRFEETLQMVAEILGRLIKMTQEQHDEIMKLKTIFMMIMDIDEDEVDSFINEFIKQ